MKRNPVVIALATLSLVTLGSSASRGGAISQSASAPVGAVVSHETNTGSAVPFRTTDNPGSNRLIAQSFTMTQSASIAAIALKSNNTGAGASNVYPAAGTHVIQIAIMQDTNGNDIGDAQVGGISTFDVAGLTLTHNNYVTFTLDAPVNLVNGQKYSFEVFFTTADTANGFGFWRSNNNNSYAGGSFAAYNNVLNSPFPGGDTNLATDTTRDVTFFVLPVPEPAALLPAALGLLALRRPARPRT